MCNIHQYKLFTPIVLFYFKIVIKNQYMWIINIHAVSTQISNI